MHTKKNQLKIREMRTKATYQLKDLTVEQVALKLEAIHRAENEKTNLRAKLLEFVENYAKGKQVVYKWH